MAEGEAALVRVYQLLVLGQGIRLEDKVFRRGPHTLLVEPHVLKCRVQLLCDFGLGGHKKRRRLGVRASSEESGCHMDTKQ